MRLWRLGNSRGLASPKYWGISDTQYEETIHLFRALLRQCTYLPDPVARGYMKGHVISRFRDYHSHNAQPKTSFRRKRTKMIEQRRPTLLKKARKGLLYLQRANDGHLQHLGKILLMTYGRLGKRRHQLLKNLKIPDIPVDQVAIEKLSDPRSQGVPQPSQQLLALIKSQARRKRSHFSRSKAPTLAPRIPETNSWGRPMPVKRVRNIKRGWYAQALDRIMPPLPEMEWERIRKLASGEVPWEGNVPRRGQLGIEGYTKGLVRGQGFLSTPHEVTPRYMRRLWVKIFAQCPLMRPSSVVRTGWEVKWGDVTSARDMVLKHRDRGDGGGFAMFEGVDESGKLLRPPAPPPITENHEISDEPARMVA